MILKIPLLLRFFLDSKVRDPNYSQLCPSHSYLPHARLLIIVSEIFTSEYVSNTLQLPEKNPGLIFPLLVFPGNSMFRGHFLPEFLYESQNISSISN